MSVDHDSDTDGRHDSLRKQELDRKLRDKTLQVYVYLQRKKVPSGIREIQRDLGLSSPSVAEYQVQKLIDMGLVARDNYGRCFVARKAKVKAFESYVNFGRFTVPRLSFYAGVFSAIAILYFIFKHGNWSLYGLAVPLTAAAILWFETWKMWRHILWDQAMIKGRKNLERNKQQDIVEAKPVHANYVQTLILPGLTALVVFILVNVFLFYHIEPNRIAISPAPTFDPTIDPSSSARGSVIGAGPLTVDDSVRIAKQNMEDFYASSSAGSSNTVLSSFSPSALATIGIFGGALVTGFLVYIVVKCRCDRNYSSTFRPNCSSYGAIRSGPHCENES